MKILDGTTPAFKRRSFSLQMCMVAILVLSLTLSLALEWRCSYEASITAPIQHGKADLHWWTCWPVALVVAMAEGSRENLNSNLFAFSPKFRRSQIVLAVAEHGKPSLIEIPHFVTFLLCHRELALGFPPQKCCSLGDVVSSDDNFSSPFNFNCMMMGLWVYV
uniref:Uncharacterized protein n=1 Tax=Glycine max TaxID=3847 RepID=C6T3G8_SOYBN|nr:unknown [Glycine max]|eukprot:NP_001235703.1 uncharacterized protein LOC100527156 [Glycine max]